MPKKASITISIICLIAGIIILLVAPISYYISGVVFIFIGLIGFSGDFIKNKILSTITRLSLGIIGIVLIFHINNMVKEENIKKYKIEIQSNSQ